MTDESKKRCPSVDPVWDRHCDKTAGHEGPHRNDELNDTLTWGTVAQARAYARKEGR